MRTLRLPNRSPVVCALMLAAAPSLGAPAAQPGKPAPAAPVPVPAAAPAPAPTAPTPAPAAAPSPAAKSPLPAVAMVSLAPVGKVGKNVDHMGRLMAMLVEDAALQSGGVQVITQGALQEMLEDLGVAPDSPIDEQKARSLAQLSGASSVVFGTFEPAAEAGKFIFRVSQFGVVAGTTKALPEITGAPAEALQQLTTELGKEWGLASLPVMPVPATEKAQRGFIACATFADLAIERVGIKGRRSKAPPAVLNGCKDAMTDKKLTGVESIQWSIQTLGGDAKAQQKLAGHLATHPEDRTAAMALIRFQAEQGEFDDAGKLLTDLQARRPRDVDVLRLAGEIAIAKDDWEAARWAFQQAVAESPNSPYLRYRLSYASYRTDKPQDALDHARAALKLAGYEAPFYQLNLGERLLDSGDVMEAKLQLMRSVEKSPRKLTPRVRLGYAYLKAGEYDKALEQLQAAEKIPATEREKERGVDALLKLDLAIAHAGLGNAKDAVKYLEALKKAGQLEAADMEHAEFVKLKEDATFKKFKVK